MRILEPGQTLFVQGDACKGVFILNTGVVGLRRTDEQGNSALFSLAGPGEVVGYRAFLANDLHCNSAEALTRCRVLFIQRSDLWQWLDGSPPVRDYILHKALADLNRAHAQCAGLLTESLRSRFVKLLMQMRDYSSQLQGAPAFLVEVPIQRKDIAALLGAAPGSLSRLLSDLEDEGLIAIDGRWIDFTGAARTMGFTETSSCIEVMPRSEILAFLMEARLALLSMIEARDAATREALNVTVQTASRRLDSKLSQVGPGAVREAQKFQDVWELFKSTRQIEIIPAVFSGRTERARQIATGVQGERLANMKSILMPAM
jgi:CRP/FNR family transcriptional regulator